MKNHSRQSRARREVVGKDLTIAITGDLTAHAGCQKPTPNIFAPKTWTPEFCRARAKDADAEELHGFAREWRMRALVLEHHTEVKSREQNRAHPYSEMVVDKDGREVSSLTITPALREALIGAMEHDYECLPDTE